MVVFRSAPALDRKLSVLEYDEDRVLGNYICGNYGSLMTEFECKVEMAFLVSSKIEHMNPNSPVRIKMEQKFSTASEPEVAAVVAAGLVSFRRAVTKRLLEQHPTEVFVNRCAKCSCVVRTPKARQCFWCGYSWQDAAQQSAARDAPKAARP